MCTLLYPCFFFFWDCEDYPNNIQFPAQIRWKLELFRLRDEAVEKGLQEKERTFEKYSWSVTAKITLGQNIRFLRAGPEFNALEGIRISQRWLAMSPHGLDTHLWPAEKTQWPEYPDSCGQSCLSPQIAHITRVLSAGRFDHARFPISGRPNDDSTTFKPGRN